MKPFNSDATIMTIRALSVGGNRTRNNPRMRCRVRLVLSEGEKKSLIREGLRDANIETSNQIAVRYRDKGFARRRIPKRPDNARLAADVSSSLASATI